jgi:F-type H+-transporting ATPase subunit b
MELVRPEIGLLFWMLLSFSIVLYILRKFAWRPILKALKERENSITDALKSADKAKEEMSRLQADNERIINEAKIERDNLIKEAREVKEKIIAEAKLRASEEAEKLLEAAKRNIESEKNAAISEMKVSIAKFSVEIAEKILRKKLSDDKAQKMLIEDAIKDIKLS